MTCATSRELSGRQGCRDQSRIGRAVALNFIKEIRTQAKKRQRECRGPAWRKHGQVRTGSAQYKGNNYLARCGCGCPVLTAHAQTPTLVWCHVHCSALRERTVSNVDPTSAGISS
jgi:hypothetical protein